MPLTLRRVWGGLRRRLAPTLQERSHARWVRDDGDRTLRLSYPLTPRSIVLDVGGFRGDWADAMSRRYGCTIHVFEPVPEFAAAIETRLHDRPGVHVHRFGLAGSTRRAAIAVAGDGTSIVRGDGRGVEPGGRRGPPSGPARSDPPYSPALQEAPAGPQAPPDQPRTAEVVAASEFLGDPQFTAIDLIKINIEGAEYELLEHLIAERIVPRIRYLQIQFHPWVSRAATRAEAIRGHLSATHRCTWSYPWIWESWERKS